MALIGDKDILTYEKHRYAGWDQWLVNRREKALVRRLLSQLTTHNSQLSTLLDIPCGYGRFSTLFAEHQAGIICADVSAAMVGRARERLKAEGRKGWYVVMDIRHLPFRDNTIGATFTMRLFHHGFARDEMAVILRELARVSQRWVILSYYRYNAFHAFFRRMKSFSSRIRMMTDAEFVAELVRVPLVFRSRMEVIPFLHAQTMVVLEKSGP